MVTTMADRLKGVLGTTATLDTDRDSLLVHLGRSE